jgi:hypothetical protein
VTTENNDGWIDGKFIVRRADGRDAPGCKHHGCQYFVLDLDHDSSALPTLRAYMRACKDERPALSHDLAVVIEMLETQWGHVGEVDKVHRDEREQALDDWRHDFQYGLESVETDRCFSCRHIDLDRFPAGEGVCDLLSIAVANVRTSRCPGHKAVG